MSLTSIILLDLFGLENLSTTFGIISCCRGLSAIVGPPLAGLLFEATNSFTGMFLGAGGLLILSSATSCGALRYEKNNTADEVDKHARKATLNHSSPTDTQC